MGPCQGGFCTFRAAGVVAERVALEASAPRDAGLPPEAVDRTLLDFIAERFRGTQPIAWGRQLQELWLTAGLYSGVLGIGTLVDRPGPSPDPDSIDEVDRAVV